MELSMWQAKLEVALGKDYTDEQQDLYSDFTVPTISFSLPGTGKTQTAVAGLLTAELHHKIPGNKIVALSFTKLATVELMNRHADACEKMRIHQNVRFSTLHKLCSEILHTYYSRLGFSKLDNSGQLTYKENVDYFLNEARDCGIRLSTYKVRKLVGAVANLNSGLVFDRRHVESRYVFKSTGLSYEDFTTLRKNQYYLNKAMEVVQVGDITLYALEILENNPDIVAELRSKNKIMLIDEFQDLSLIQLRLAYLMCENLVVIGDINQQIYAFNGACQEIVAEYFKMYPNARKVNLTKSFRCGDEIAAFATSLIIANNPAAAEFKGNGKKSTVTITDSLDYKKIIEKVSIDFVENRNVFPKNIMFLVRANLSLIPVIEELFKNDLPFRVVNYVPAHQIPLIDDMCAIIELCRNPKMPNNVGILNKLIPEFQCYYKLEENPIYKIMLKTGKSAFDIEYNYKESSTAMQALSVIKRVSELLKANAYVKDIFNVIFPTFKSLYLNDNNHKYEQDVSYYCRVVSSVIQEKTYQKFVQDELSKIEKAKENEVRRRGLRCYTMHGAKGTEADVVYILDANEGLIPNTKKLQEMLDVDCPIDVAREIRNERSLVYVACTRAKEELVISHSGGALSSLFTEENKYQSYDDIYKNATNNFDDIEAFKEFVKDVS